MSSLPLVASQICAAYMCGVIWLIQLIHYPSFVSVEPSQFANFHHRHSAVMGVLVGPVMIVELLAGLWLVSQHAHVVSLANVVIVLLLWIFTFFVSVPLHNQLSAGFDLKVIHQLVLTNWPRTFLWTAKLALTSYWLFRGDAF